MLPNSIALIDDDAEFAEYLAQYLRNLDVSVDVFGCAEALMSMDDAAGFDFYLVDLGLPDQDGLSLIADIRRRTDAGVVVVSGRVGPEVFKQVIQAGADMYLTKPVQFEQIALVLTAVQRRVGPPGQATPAWGLNQAAAVLVAPDGAQIKLSDIDLAILSCFLEAKNEVISRETLQERMGHRASNANLNTLNATIYRLRRRIERATPALVPLQARSRQGYVFRATLNRLDADT